MARVDIHAHILPGLDDGPVTVEDSLAMARMAAQDGTDTIVATPTTAIWNLNARLLKWSGTWPIH